MKGLFIAVWDVDAPLALFAGGQTLRQAVQKLFVGKMNGEVAFRGGNCHISLVHLFPQQPHGHGKGDFRSQLRIFCTHKVNECADMLPLLFVQRCHILRNRSCAHIIPPTAYWDCCRSHSFFRMAYCTVFSYLGVPSGLFTKEMNSRNMPSRRMPSFSHRCWLERL